MYTLINKLRDTHNLTKNEWLLLIEHLKGSSLNSALSEYLFSQSRSVQNSNYGKKIFIRGLIEISNICKNDCLYCGIRASNKNAKRYRLTPDEILNCADKGHEIGFRTFVLQGGEDPYFTDDVLCEIITKIKNKHTDSAVTLSLGERSKESYEKLKKAGADRYLLRHETANHSHYAKLHPSNLKLSDRKECLFNLKEAGFQTGSGFLLFTKSSCSAIIKSDHHPRRKHFETARFRFSEYRPHLSGASSGSRRRNDFFFRIHKKRWRQGV